MNYYLSLGGSLLDLDVCFWSGPTAGCEGSTPLLLSTCAPGEAVSWEEAAAVLKGVWDLDRSWSRAFFSLGTSDPAPVAVSLRVPSWLGCWGPLPKNHAPDLVKISCCFRHKLHTHITYLKERKSNIKKKLPTLFTNTLLKFILRVFSSFYVPLNISYNFLYNTPSSISMPGLEECLWSFRAKFSSHFSVMIPSFVSPYACHILYNRFWCFIKISVSINALGEADNWSEIIVKSSKINTSKHQPQHLKGFL